MYRVNQHHVERFGLFTIIVLGECINGTMHGFHELPTQVRLPFLLGVLALLSAVCIQWIYFNQDGRASYCVRVPLPPFRVPKFSLCCPGLYSKSKVQTCSSTQLIHWHYLEHLPFTASHGPCDRR